MQLPIPRSSFLLILIKILLLLAFSLMPSMVVRPFIGFFFAIYLITSHLKYIFNGFMVQQYKPYYSLLPLLCWLKHGCLFLGYC